jgi:hypothetical protein
MNTKYDLFCNDFLLAAIAIGHFFASAYKAKKREIIADPPLFLRSSETHLSLTD